MNKKRKSSSVQIVFRPGQKEQLEAFCRSQTLPSFLSRRARIVLLAADGMQNQDIAEVVGLNRNDVGKWRRRFASEGIEGLYDQLRPGRPRTIDDERVAEVINKTLKSKPENSTHWTTSLMSEKSGVSRTTVHRIWHAFGLQPHRQTSFKLSTDPFFVEKVIDIVGLYLDPPQSAMVLCVDEKSQCQALERTQPVLPMGLGYAEGITHDYIRHGTTTLFAALDVATGEVIAQCKPKHRHQEFLSFLRSIESNVPKNLNVHVIMDNYASHKHPKVKAWFAQRPRFHPHFTPTYSSWLNQVERWFGIITQRAIRRGSFTSTKQLVEKIELFVKNHNQNCKPFNWVATSNSIFEKIERLCNKISGTAH